MAKKQTAGRDRLGELAPKFAELNDDVLFGQVWSREEKLSARDRSMVTIAALFSAGLYPQLKSHLALGKEHGITKEEAVEIVTQLAFYCGWLMNQFLENILLYLQRVFLLPKRMIM